MRSFMRYVRAYGSFKRNIEAIDKRRSLYGEWKLIEEAGPRMWCWAARVAGR